MNIHRAYMTVFVASTMVALMFAAGFAISTIIPPYKEHFFAMGILDENKRAEHYYPNGKSTIGNNTIVRWYIYIHNHMYAAQDVSIRVKLVNSTQEGPNDFRHKPAQVDTLFEFPLHLADNETQLIPFTWSYPEVFYGRNLAGIPYFVVNNETLRINGPVISDGFLRMVFELWVYNRESGQYEFSWRASEEVRSISLSMVFRVPIPEAFRSLFSDGFERGDTSGWTRVRGRPVVVTDHVNSGKYALECDHGEGVVKTLEPNSTTYFARFYFMLSDIPPDSATVILIRAYDETTTELYHIQLRNTRSALRIHLVRRYPFSATNEYLYNFSANTWYRVEVKSHLNSSLAEYRVYLDGEEAITDITLYGKERTDDVRLLKRVTLGQLSATYLVTVYIDDVAINDKYIGPLKQPE